MIRSRSMALLMGAACILGTFAVEARAGSLEMLITESGGPTIPVTDNGALDTDPTIGVINANTTLLNLSLVNYQFTQLGSNSNSPGTAVTGSLSQAGVAQLLVGGTGSITVVATDVDYSQPAPGPGTMHTGAGATFSTATNGNSNAFQGWYNPSNGLAATDVPSPVTTYTASGQPASDPHPHVGEPGTTDTPITLVNPYGLTSSTIITLSGGSPGALAQDAFNGTVQTFSTAIPEPASMALMLGALPVLVFGLMRRRRAAA